MGPSCLQRRRILLCDRFGLSNSPRVGGVKKWFQGRGCLPLPQVFLGRVLASPNVGCFLRLRFSKQKAPALPGRALQFSLYIWWSLYRSFLQNGSSSNDLYGNNALIWRMLFFLSPPLALASSIACVSRVTSRDSPKWGACSLLLARSLACACAPEETKFWQEPDFGY